MDYRKTSSNSESDLTGYTVVRCDDQLNCYDRYLGIPPENVQQAFHLPRESHTQICSQDNPKHCFRVGEEVVEESKDGEW
jgi:hypothetical protein